MELEEVRAFRFRSIFSSNLFTRSNVFCWSEFKSCISSCRHELLASRSCPWSFLGRDLVGVTDEVPMGDSFLPFFSLGGMVLFLIISLLVGSSVLSFSVLLLLSISSSTSGIFDWDLLFLSDSGDSRSLLNWKSCSSSSDPSTKSWLGYGLLDLSSRLTDASKLTNFRSVIAYWVSH